MMHYIFSCLFKRSCLVCGNNALREFARSQDFDYKGEVMRLHVIESRCDSCGVTLLSNKQSKKNKATYSKWRRMIDHEQNKRAYKI